MIVTNKYGLPEPIVQAVSNNYTPTPNRYGVTSLLNGATQTILKRRWNDVIVTDASDNIFALFGKATHAILERQHVPNVLQEYRIEVPAGDGISTISGIVDLYDLKTNTIIDYKTGSVWKVKFNDWKDYRAQIALYAWMLNQCGYPCHSGQITLIMKDHSKSEAKRDRSYPPHPVHVENFFFTDEELEEAHQKALQRISEIRELEDVPTENLPPCDPESRWYSGTTYAVMNGKAKKALRVLCSEEEAQKWMEEKKKGTHIVERPGKDKRCIDYCDVAKFCPFWRMKYGQADSENKQPV